MHIRDYQGIKGAEVKTEGAKGVNMRVVAGPEHGALNFTMRVFTIEPGGNTPLHHHDFEHEIFIHEGLGQLVYEGKVRELWPGFVAYIPPNVEHQFRNTGTTPMVFVCVVPKI